MRRCFAPQGVVVLFGAAAAQEVRVFAAASLAESFAEIAATFEDRYPGSEVLVNVAGSSTLAAQLLQGAPGDVFASADQRQMARVVDDGLVFGEPRVFARNRLVVITPIDSDIDTLSDLARPGVLLVLAGAEVPAGRYARAVLAQFDEVYGEGFSQRVLANLVSSEPNVRQVAAKVELGEADAALVYATDAAVLGNVRIINIPVAANITADYPIAVIADSPQRDLADAFVDLVLGDTGQEILGRYGFLSP
ncbi:MAG: molybdate ABC transporter substrate-binding protein [Trueperaceae bacterium]|nr:molybdate ABC transporter substrate-binding protein [Trueperaceae bacterium]